MNDQSTNLSSGWYVVNSQVNLGLDYDSSSNSFNGIPMYINGDVKIIVAVGAGLFGFGSVVMGSGSKLTIYGQSGQTGQFTITALNDSYNDGITVSGSNNTATRSI